MRFLASIAAGAIVAWSFYPNHWWAAIIGIAILLLTFDSKSRRTRVKLSLVFALTFFAFHVRWVSVLGNDAWIGLVILCTLPWLLLGIVPVDSKSKWFYLQPAAAVIVIEAIRANWPWGGFPWGLVAYSQVDGPLVGLSTLGGQALVSGVVVVCAAIAVKFVKFRSISALILLLFISICSASVNSFTSSYSVQLAAIQGNVPRVGNELSTQRAAVLNNHLRTTEQLLTDIESGMSPAPDLIVWPESGTDIDPLVPGVAADAINKLATRSTAPILIGATTWYSTGSKGEGPTNSGIMWSDKGPSQIYSKNHLVPFGEYVPLRDVLAKWITRFDQVPNDFVPGDGPGVFDVSGMQIGDVICFEVAYANHIYDTINAGAQVITVQTNNATYGNTTQPEQQFAITRFRAIETQRAFLVASTSGISGLIQNDGSVSGRTNQFEAVVVTGEAALISEKTFSTKYPFWVLILSISVLLIRLRRASGSKNK
jgi:apolipoprotein N-acyltransferase